MLVMQAIITWAWAGVRNLQVKRRGEGRGGFAGKNRDGSLQLLLCAVTAAAMPVSPALPAEGSVFQAMQLVAMAAASPQIDFVTHKRVLLLSTAPEASFPCRTRTWADFRSSVSRCSSRPRSCQGS